MTLYRYDGPYAEATIELADRTIHVEIGDTFDGPEGLDWPLADEPPTIPGDEPTTEESPDVE